MNSPALRTEGPVPRRDDFAVSDDQVNAVLDRHLREEYKVTDAAWREIAAKAIGNRRLGKRRWLRRMLSMGRNAQQQEDVRTIYESHWDLNETLEQFVSCLNDRTLTAQWRDRGMRVAYQSLRQVHLLYLMRAVEVLRPRKVLEVGCGNGNVILTLAARFPDVKFSGVELTQKGVAIAQAVQALPELPPGMVENSPEPLLDLTAHCRVALQISDARALSFPDRSFDLVYTRLALEQMEEIREKALKEICRVSDRALVLIEPWRDFNSSDPGRAYVRRAGYFTGKIRGLEKMGFKVAFSTADIPQKVQFNAGPVVAIRD